MTAVNPPLPVGRTVRLGASRIAYEVKAYFRQGDSVFFTFLFPLVFLTIFSVAFSNSNFGKDAAGNTLTAADYYLTGMLAAVALSALPRSGKSATAVIIPITLILPFISGVYLPFSQLPAWLQNFAGFFPLKWLAQGMRSVFLPDSFKAVEQGGSWDLPGVLIVTAIWLVVGLVLCRVTFRWIRKDA